MCLSVCVCVGVCMREREREREQISMKRIKYDTVILVFYFHSNLHILF